MLFFMPVAGRLAGQRSADGMAELSNIPLHQSRHINKIQWTRTGMQSQRVCGVARKGKRQVEEPDGAVDTVTASTQGDPWHTRHALFRSRSVATTATICRVRTAHGEGLGCAV